jgi:hypothetical protein
MSDIGAMTCYRHSKVETSLRCSRCEKPICADCAVPTPVGYRCRECGKERSATLTLEAKHLFPGLVVGFGVPFLAGYLATRVPLGLFLIFLGAMVGGLVGPLIRKAIGMKSSPLLAAVSIAGYFLGVLAVPIYRTLASGGNLDHLTAAFFYPWPLVFAAVAAISTSVQLK